MPPRPFLIALILFAAASRCGAAVEFSGYTTVGGETKFLLTDPAAKHSGVWRTLGERFGDYIVFAFDQKKEVLFVKAPDAAPFGLPLKASRVTAGQSRTNELEAQLAAEKKLLEELRKRYLEKYPKVIEQQRRIAALEQQLAESMTAP